MKDPIRVQWKATGHETTIPERKFDGEKHKRLDKPALTKGGDPAPPKYRTTVTKAAEKKAGSATKATDDMKES